MTPREELVEVVKQMPDDLVQASLVLLRGWQRHQSSDLSSSHLDKTSVDEPKYDFSDLVGRLNWQGDAVSAQRALRDEW